MRPWRTGSILWLATLALFLAARARPELVEEHYSRRAYSTLAGWLGLPAEGYARATRALDGRFVPSLSEWLVAALALFAAWRLRALVGRRRAQPSRLRGLARWLGEAWLATGVLALAFTLAWGLNHARRPLLENLGWERGEASREALAGLARHLANVAAEERPALATDARGLVVAPADLAARAAAAFERAARERPLFAGPRPIVRAPAASAVLIAARVSGVFSPFTGESHVARGLPAASRGFVVCHEIAHRRGWAREDEANAVAFLVAIDSGDPALRYSAATVGLAHVLPWLLVRDPELWGEVVAALDEGVVRDLEAESEFWSRRRSLVVRGFGRLATATNDAYLRSMGAHDGIQSYGRMVDALLAWRRLDAPAALPWPR